MIVTSHTPLTQKSGKSPVEPANNADSPLDLQSPESMSPQNILRLQRIIGNQAVQRIPLDSNVQRPDATRIMYLQRTVGNAATRRLIEPRSTATPIILQRQLMSYKEFRTATGQTATTTSLQEFKEKGRFGRTRKVNKVVETEHVNLSQEEIFTGAVGANALQKERHQNNPKYDLGGTDTLKVNINAAFEAYEAEPESLQKLIELYNTITYWQAANLGRSWVAASAGIIDTLMKQIQAEVQIRTAKMGGETSASTADSLAKPGSQPKAKMPDFLQEVGIPQAYFDEHIAGKQPIIESLESFYNNLKAGKLYEASRAWRAVSHLPASYQIRGPFLAHFSSAANLGKIVNTEGNTQEGQELTPAEKKAIQNYSVTGYGGMNTALRGHDMRAAEKPVTLGTERMKRRQLIPGMGFWDARQPKKEDGDLYDDKKNSVGQASLAVSALNKLPKYEGRLYRIVQQPPQGFMKGISPGGVLVDLGFSSASPSMTGVHRYDAGSMYRNDSRVYYILKVKTAVSIMAYTDITKEAEVLIRPGTRFQVQSIWQHKNGKVPTDAPAEAQMILHTYGEFKGQDGKQNEDTRIKVIELTEI